MPRPSRYAPNNLDRDRHWTDDAACAGKAMDGIEFFPLHDKNKSSAKGDARHLKATFCGGCPVRIACLEHAMTFPETHGVWGGLDWEELAELRGEVQAARAEQQEPEQGRATRPAGTEAAA
ncbi:WhiB family transcriptional regulator [Embleya sp. AB8]|uniref:WhiB family transcriptional regulator n=1 Tax=Embleya sp. AB8 TaxID=3156304 RepID=UPI003C717B67